MKTKILTLKEFEEIVKNIIREESEEEYNFLKKVKSENPTLYSRFYSIVKNKGLAAAQEKYQEHDPELIKQKEKAQKKLDKQVAKIEKNAPAYAELNDFMESVNFLRKNFNVLKEVGKITKKIKNTKLLFDTYKIKDHINPLYNSDPIRLKRNIDMGFLIPLETIEIYNKFQRRFGGSFGEPSDTIIIKSQIDPKEKDLVFSITFKLYEDYMSSSMIDKIINKIKERWNYKTFNNLKTRHLINKLDEFNDEFDKENIENLRLRILAKRN
jgi:hypothetical protein